VAAVGVKDKPKAKASKKTTGKNSRGKDPAASAKAIPKKAPKKAPRKKVAGKNEEKPNPVNRRKIRGSDAAGKGEVREAVPMATMAELDPFEVARKTMKGSVPAIVEAMVELAKQGSCSHAKTLLEMTGAKHMFDGEAAEQDGGESWAKLVLERLDETELAAGQETLSLQDGSLELVGGRS
jgi:hypothetical protein